MKKSYIIFFLFVIIFYLMNVIIPFYGDDLTVFHTVKDLDLAQFVTKIFSSYLTYNGRFFCNLFMYSNIYIWNESVFNVLNTLFFTCLLWLTTKLTVSKVEKYPITITLCATCIFLLSTGHDSLHYWGAGATNYLWPAVMTTTIIYIYQRLISINNEKQLNHPIFLGIVVCILSLSHEALIFPVAAGFCFFYLTHLKNLNKKTICFLLGLFIGAILVVLSPSQISKFLSNSENEALSMSFTSKVIAIFAELKVFYVLIFLLIVLYIKNKQHLVTFITSNKIICYIILFSFVLPIMAGVRGRASYPTELFSIILLARLINDFDFIKSKYCLYSLLSFSLLFWVIVTYDSYHKWNIYRAVVSTYYSQEDNVVYRDNFQGCFLTKKYEVDLDRLFNLYHSKSGLTVIKKEKTGNINAKTLITIPKDVCTAISNGMFNDNKNLIKGNGQFYTTDDITYYVTKWTEKKEQAIHKDLLCRKLSCVFFSSLKIHLNNFETHPIDIGGNIIIMHNKIGDYILVEKNYHTIPFTKLDAIDFLYNRPKNLVELHF